MEVEIRFFFDYFEIISSVMRQKGKSQNGGYKKTKYAKFSKNEHFLPNDTHIRVCIKG